MTQVTANDAKRCPIHLDHHGPEHAKTWPETFRTLQAQNPRPWSDAYDGFWIATRRDDIVGICQRADAFSANKTIDPVTGEESGGIAIPRAPGVRAIPNETENPEWEAVRRFVSRRFAPAAAEQRRERTRQFAAALIDKVIETGRFDIVDDLTNPLPALVTMEIFGFPLDEWRAFADPFHEMMYTAPTDPAFGATIRALDYFGQRVDEEVALRRAAPKDDFLTLLATGTIGGEPLDHRTIQALSFNILAGGVDTTTALTSHALIHLARNPQDRQRLIDNLELLPFACEEFLRYYSPVHGLARNATKDTEVNGWAFQKGDRVLLAFAAGNRDPEAFEDPDVVKIDRFPNKHVGFGAGMHRCLGSFLARMMFQEMVTAVLDRMPDYELVEDRLRPYPSIGGISGWINIPARFTPGKKVGAVID